MIVYSIMNLKTDKRYVGITTRQGRKFDEYWGSGKLIEYSIKKYGLENFDKEVLQICFNREEMFEAERYWIQKLKTMAPNGYNMHPGGTHMTTKDVELECEDLEVVIDENKRIRNKIPLDSNWREKQDTKIVGWRNHRLKKHIIQNTLTGEVINLLGQDGAKNFVKEYNQNCFMTNLKINWVDLLYKEKSQQFILLKTEKVYHG